MQVKPIRSSQPLHLLAAMVQREAYGAAFIVGFRGDLRIHRLVKELTLSFRKNLASFKI